MDPMDILDLYGDRILLNDNGCWDWVAGVSSEGYGRARLNGKMYYMHRLSFTITNGSIPAGLLIRHTCHNPRCCNPQHLILGTDHDNWLDSETVHRANHLKQSHPVRIGRVTYKSINDAYRLTTISTNAIMKYTHDGVFDIAAYRMGCGKARKIPKV